MNNIGDEKIHAFVDGELSTEERLEMLAAIEQNPDLAREIQAINQLKVQLQQAFAYPLEPPAE